MKRSTTFIISFYVFFFGCMIFSGTANAGSSCKQVSVQTSETKGCKTVIVKEDTPKEFKDSGVTRVLKDGTIQKFDGDKYKIVPRTQRRKKCPEKVVKIVEERVVVKQKRNHLQLYIGNGPSDSLSSSINGNTISVQSEDENLLGLGYSRDIIDLDEDTSLSLGVFYFTNETVGASVGISW